MQHPDLVFSLLVAVAAGAAAYVVFSLINDFKNWFNASIDATANPRMLAKRGRLNTPFNKLVLTLVGLPLVVYAMSHSHASSSRAYRRQAIREEAVAKGYAILCTTYAASYQANKAWCDHPHWVGE